jgi:hypothetical protein
MLNKDEKLAYVNWLISKAGPSKNYFLRRLNLRIRTKFFLFFSHLLKGSFVTLPKLNNVYVPSSGQIKRLTIKRYAQKYNTNFFVETGTYMGDTTEEVCSLFKKSFTIEFSKELFLKAKNRFKYNRTITCIHGDSGLKLKKVLTLITKKSLFWLDAHHSGGITGNAGYDPLMKELGFIFKHKIKNHVILIDDIRGHDFEEIKRITPKFYRVEIRNDIARIIPIKNA